jgi:hypothetical protein
MMGTEMAFKRCLFNIKLFNMADGPRTFHLVCDLMKKLVAGVITGKCSMTGTLGK